jgi:peptidoglycan/xylan/chitin deacetylase (PgdA/CDA1 family)
MWMTFYYRSPLRADNLKAMNSRYVSLVLLLGLIAAGTVNAQLQGLQPETVSVPILIYHSIRPYRSEDLGGVRKYVTTPEALEQELAYLRENGYSAISFDDLERHLQTGAGLPENPVIISFDDGPETQYTYALPLLKKYSFTATFFLFTNAIGHENYLSWEQVLELQAEGMQIGCHSRFHPYLTRLRTEKELWAEIAGSKERLEAHLGAPVTVFAYPFGQYDDHVVELVKKAGYTCARGTFPGTLHSQGDLFTLTGLIHTATLKSLVISLKETQDENRTMSLSRKG